MEKFLEASRKQAETAASRNDSQWDTLVKKFQQQLEKDKQNVQDQVKSAQIWLREQEEKQQEKQEKQNVSTRKKWQATCYNELDSWIEPLWNALMSNEFKIPAIQRECRAVDFLGVNDELLETYLTDSRALSLVCALKDQQKKEELLQTLPQPSRCNKQEPSDLLWLPNFNMKNFSNMACEVFDQHFLEPAANNLCYSLLKDIVLNQMPLNNITRVLIDKKKSGNVDESILRLFPNKKVQLILSAALDNKVNPQEQYKHTFVITSDPNTMRKLSAQGSNVVLIPWGKTFQPHHLVQAWNAFLGILQLKSQKIS